MKRIVIALLSLILVAAVRGAEPTAEAVNRLMEPSHVDEMLVQALKQMDNGIRTAMEQGAAQAQQGKELTAAQKAALAKCQDKVSAMIQDELSLNKTKDLYVKAYQATFTQEEIDGIVAFYNTPAGKALVEKSAVAMEKAGKDMQGRIQPVMQKIQAMQADCVKEIQKAK